MTGMGGPQVVPPRNPPRNPIVPPMHDSFPSPGLKSQMCNKYNTPEGCKFGDKCRFAHGERELGMSSSPSYEDLRAPLPGLVGGMFGRIEPPLPGHAAAASFGASATAKISVDGSLAEAIIGKGGVNSKQICLQTGAKLSIREHKSDPNLRNIKLEGTFDQIKQASAMVRELIVNVGSATSDIKSPVAVPPPHGPASNNFKTKLCDNFTKGSCTFGDRCHFAHGAGEAGVVTKEPQSNQGFVPGEPRIVERERSGCSRGVGGESIVNVGSATSAIKSSAAAPPPHGPASNNFKTKLCDNFTKGSCMFGDRCHFAHGVGEAGVVKEPQSNRGSVPGEPKIVERERSGCSRGVGGESMVNFGSAASTIKSSVAAPPPHGLASNNFKTKLCDNFTKGSCMFGNRCPFAHGACEAGVVKEPQSNRGSVPGEPRIVKRERSGSSRRVGGKSIVNVGSAASAIKSSVAAPLSHGHASNNFKTKLCDNFTKGSCMFGDRCHVAHGASEAGVVKEPQSNRGSVPGEPRIGKRERSDRSRGVGGESIVNVGSAASAIKSSIAAPPPHGPVSNNFKTKLCDNFTKGSCTFGERCHFAHGAGEARVVKKEPQSNRGSVPGEPRIVKRERSGRSRGVGGERSNGGGNAQRPVDGKQGVMERRVIRSRYLAMKNLINDEKEDLSRVDSDKFTSIISEVESLHQLVQKPREQVADAEALLDITNALVTSVRSHGNEVTPSNLVTSLLHNFGQLNGGLVTDEPSVSIDWKSIGLSVSHIFNRVPGCSTMLGPMDAELKQRKVGVRQKRVRPTESARPEQLNNNNADEKTDTDKNMSTMFNILKKKSNVRLEHLILNRQSFAQTVENLFAMSFLVKDGRVEITVDDNGHHLVLAPKNAPASSSVLPGEVAYRHFVFRFDYKDWKTMIDMVQSDELLMPHRVREDVNESPTSSPSETPGQTAAPTTPIRKLTRNQGLVMQEQVAEDSPENETDASKAAADIVLTLILCCLPASNASTHCANLADLDKKLYARIAS